MFKIPTESHDCIEIIPVHVYKLFFERKNKLIKKKKALLQKKRWIKYNKYGF